MQAEQLEEGWVYVVVQDPEKNEKFLGMEDTQLEIKFIPAFETKDEALGGMIDIPRDKQRKYEIQAVHIDDLTRHARTQGMMVFMLDRNGKVLKKL